MTSRLKHLFERLFHSLVYLPRTLAMVWQAARFWTLGWAALLIAQGALPAVLVWCTKALVDSFTASGQIGGQMAGPIAGQAQLRPILFYAALAGAAMLLIELLHRVGSYIQTAQSELLKDHITALIQRKSAEVDFAFYEMPEYHDHLHRARADASYRPIALLENLGGSLQGAVTLVALLAVLLPYGWWLPLSLLVATVPLAVAVMINTLRRYNWQRRATEAERRSWYYDWVLTATDTAAEVRLFGLSEYFRQAYAQLRLRLRQGQLAVAKREVVLEFIAGLFALAITGATLGWMAWRTLQGAATLGTLALFYQAFNQGQQLLRSLVGNFSGCYTNGLFLGDLFAFLELQPNIPDPESPLPMPDELAEGIEFDQVTFRYPGSERPALDGFSLTIPAGQITAIVGLNGAGKTTLIKLLCRLYDPDAGTITMDGIDLRQMRQADLRRAITVLFQHPVHYNATVADNIRLGRLNQAGKGSDRGTDFSLCRGSVSAEQAEACSTFADNEKLERLNQADNDLDRGTDFSLSQLSPLAEQAEACSTSACELTEAKIRMAAEQAGAAEVVNRLPDGYDTMLGKLFSDGTELSGGEWQRLALARAFARPAQIVLLDEPTSALDSWAEADWLRRFREVMAGRTAIIITHRFTTAMQADRIHVMDEGRIVESGTHWQLLALRGRYAESWTAQMRGVSG